MILILLAEGFEEIEALTPLDLLRRGGLDVRTVGITERRVTGAHGITVLADMTPDEVVCDEVSLAIFPGGMPGAVNLDSSAFTDKVIESVVARGGRLAAICAAPLVLGRRGLLSGLHATCYPGFEDELSGAVIEDSGVVTDGLVTTARGMGVALEFALELVRLTAGDKTAEEIASGIMMRGSEDSRAQVDETHCEGDPTEALSPDLPRGSGDRLEVAERAAEIYGAAEALGYSVRLDTAERGPRFTLYTLITDRPVTDDAAAELAARAMLGIGSEVEAEVAGEDRKRLLLLIENKEPCSTGLRTLLEMPEFAASPSKMTLCLGYTVSGLPVYQDLSRMQGLLVAGESDRPAVLDALILSLLTKSKPSELKLLLIDPEASGFDKYSHISPLLAPVAHTAEDVYRVLSRLRDIIEQRYSRLSVCGVGSIEEYNRMTPDGNEPMPYAVAVFSDLPDTASDLGGAIEGLLVDISKSCRAVGIYLLVGVGCDSLHRLSPALLSAIPSRLCLDVSDGVCRSLLGEAARAHTRGGGDALYKHASAPVPGRIQTPTVTVEEVNAFIGRYSARYPSQGLRGDLSRVPSDSCDGGLAFAAMDLMLQSGSTSAPALAEGLGIEARDAESVLSLLQEIGIVSEECRGQRTLLVSPEEWAIMKKRILEN